MKKKQWGPWKINEGVGMGPQGSLPGACVAFTEPRGSGVVTVRPEKRTSPRASASAEMEMRAVFGEA